MAIACDVGTRSWDQDTLWNDSCLTVWFDFGGDDDNRDLLVKSLFAVMGQVPRGLMGESTGNATLMPLMAIGFTATTNAGGLLQSRSASKWDVR